MANLDFLKSDPEIVAAWDKPVEVDPLPAAKEKLLKQLDEVVASIKREPKKNITRWYKTQKGKDGASVGLNIGTKSVVGNTTGRTGNDRILRRDVFEFFSEAKEAIQAGKMDDDIRKALDGSGKTESSTATRAIDPAKVHRRNVTRYGEERAMELLETNVEKKGWDKAKVLADYKALSKE
ncbi:hypothetical protein PF049_00130 [Erythrobacteraceae bacterium WH01K]|nr:hypothetical protein PF049_00130 [Erythrobacteraceae bacterium WH01K]